MLPALARDEGAVADPVAAAARILLDVSEILQGADQAVHDGRRHAEAAGELPDANLAIRFLHPVKNHQTLEEGLVPSFSVPIIGAVFYHAAERRFDLTPGQPTGWHFFLQRTLTVQSLPLIPK